MPQEFHCNDLCFLKQKHPKDAKIDEEMRASGCECGEEEEL